MKLPMLNKTPEMLNMIESIFPGTIENIQNCRCTDCGLPVTEKSFRDALSIKEYEISGLCQRCQDEIFGA
jgi:hypothetical protein